MYEYLPLPNGDSEEKAVKYVLARTLTSRLRAEWKPDAAYRSRVQFRYFPWLVFIRTDPPYRVLKRWPVGLRPFDGAFPLRNVPPILRFRSSLLDPSQGSPSTRHEIRPPQLMVQSKFRIDDPPTIICDLILSISATRGELVPGCEGSDLWRIRYPSFFPSFSARRFRKGRLPEAEKPNFHPRGYLFLDHLPASKRQKIRKTNLLSQPS